MVCLNQEEDEGERGVASTVSGGSSNALTLLNDSSSYNAVSKKVQFDANMILVDAGMVARLDEEESDNFIGFLASLGEGDGRHAAKTILQFSSPTDDYTLTEEEKDAFIRDMEALFRKHCRGYGTNVRVGEVLREVLHLIRIHKVRIAANYATLVINALCIESLAHRVAPDYNLLDASRPLLQSYYRIIGPGGQSTGEAKVRANAITLVVASTGLSVLKFDHSFFYLISETITVSSLNNETMDATHVSQEIRIG